MSASFMRVRPDEEDQGTRELIPQANTESEDDFNRYEDNFMSAWDEFYQYGGEPTFEDNREHTSSDWQFLEGRVLSSHEDFTGKWIYQRFVNKSMQYLTQWSEPWYSQPIDQTHLKGTAAIILFCFVMFSPILFPLVYGLSVVLLTIGGYWTHAMVRTAAQERALKLNEHVAIKGKCTNEGKFKALKDFEPTPSWQIAAALARSVWYLWIGVLPWLYIARYGLTHTAVWVVTVCAFGCVVPAFRYTNSVLISAMTCKLEESQADLFRHPIYGVATEKIVLQLSNPDDGMSFFPIFVPGEEDDLNLPLSFKQWVFSWLVPCLHSCVPFLALGFADEQGFGDKFVADGYFWTLAPLLTCMFVLLKGVNTLMNMILEATEEYEDAVDQLFLFLYISSSRAVKQKFWMRSIFAKTVELNDDWRRVEATKEKDPLQCKWLPKGRFAEHGLDLRASTRSRQLRQQVQNRKTKDLETSTISDELTDLRIHRAAFNFTRKEGVMLFRFMRKWIITDIQNERFEVETYMNLLVILLVCLIGAFSLVVWWQLPIPWYLGLTGVVDLLIIMYYLIVVLNLCVNANEYLFDHTIRMLLDWKDQVLMKETDFEIGGRMPAVAWIFSEEVTDDAPNETPITIPVKFESVDSSPNNQDDPYEHVRRDQVRRSHVLQVLDTHIKVLAEVEKKQTFFGMEVTRDLRSRLIAVLASAAITASSRLAHFLNTVQTA